MVKLPLKLKQIQTELLKLKAIAFDIETRSVTTLNHPVYKGGLDPYLSEPVMLQLGNDKIQYVIDCRKYSKLVLKSFLQPILESDILIIGHNLQFEGKFMLHHYELRIVNCFDTYLSEKILYNGYKILFSLAACAERYLGIKSKKKLSLFGNKDNYEAFYIQFLEAGFEEGEALALAEQKVEDTLVDKSTRLEFVTIGDKPFTKKQIEYGKKDVEYPYKIWKLQMKGRRVQEFNGKESFYRPLKAFKIESKMSQVLAEMSLRGVPVSKQLWSDNVDRNEVLYKERLAGLNQFLVDYAKDFVGEADLFTPGAYRYLVDFQSPTQAVKLFRKFKLAVKAKSKSTGKMEWTVGAKELIVNLSAEQKVDLIKGNFPNKVTPNNLVLAFLLFKRVQMATTTFGRKWLRFVHPITGRLHCNFLPYLMSGRLAATKPKTLGSYKATYN